MNATDIAAIQWHGPLSPRLGNYEDCDAWVWLCAGAELVGVCLTTRDVLGWRPLDHERTAYRIAINEGEAVWIVTMDHDGAPDAHSVASRVEVLRC